MVDIDRPIATAKAQNSNCSVLVFMRLRPKLIAITKPRGASTISQRSGVAMTCAANPELANTIEMMPVSSTPEAM
jgi:hypothetical protein